MGGNRSCRTERSNLNTMNRPLLCHTPRIRCLSMLSCITTDQNCREPRLSFWNRRAKVKPPHCCYNAVGILMSLSGSLPRLCRPGLARFGMLLVHLPRRFFDAPSSQLVCKTKNTVRRVSLEKRFAYTTETTPSSTSPTKNCAPTTPLPSWLALRTPMIFRFLQVSSWIYLECCIYNISDKYTKCNPNQLADAVAWRTRPSFSLYFPGKARRLFSLSSNHKHILISCNQTRI